MIAYILTFQEGTAGQAMTLLVESSLKRLTVLPGANGNTRALRDVKGVLCEKASAELDKRPWLRNDLFCNGILSNV